MFDFDAKRRGITINPDAQDRNLSIGYDARGVFSHLSYDYNYKGKQSNFSKFLPQIEMLFKHPNQTAFTANNCSVKVALDGTKFVFMITRASELLDKATIPLAINPRELRQRFVKEPTQKDPINAPMELDDSWKHTNILQAVGVNWIRY